MEGRSSELASVLYQHRTVWPWPTTSQREGDIDGAVGCFY